MVREWLKSKWTLNPRRSDLCGGAGEVEDVVAGAGMDLEDHVALFHGAGHLLSKHLGRCPGRRPAAHGDGVTDLLAHELVCRHLQVLSHDVVQCAAEGRVEGVVEEVEGVGAR